MNLHVNSMNYSWIFKVGFTSNGSYCCTAVWGKTGFAASVLSQLIHSAKIIIKVWHDFRCFGMGVTIQKLENILKKKVTICS